MEIAHLQQVKNIIRSLVISYPQSISVELLNKHFIAFEGEPIPFKKLGYHNLEVFIRSMSDTIQIIGTGPTATVRVISTSTKSAHIDNFVSFQKKPKKVNPKSKPPPLNISDGGLNRMTVINRSYDNYPTSTRNQKNISIELQKTNVSKLRDCGRDDIIGNECFHVKSRVLESISNSIKKEERSHNKSRFDRSEKINTVKESEYLQEKSHLFQKINNSKKNDCRSIPNVEKYVDGIEQINYAFQNAVQILNPCLKSDNNETKQFRNNLMETKADTNNSASLLGTPKSKCEISNIPEVFKLSGFENNIQEIDDAVPEFAADNVVFNIDFPDNSVLFGRKITDYVLPKDIKPGSVIRIFIAEINSPFRFWFHIQENPELDFLMFKMERFYTRLLPEDFQMPPNCIKPDQVCAALYHDIWHRGEIIGGLQKDSARVFLVDYGTVASVHVKNIKYLSSMFVNVAKQAIRGCLSHISPNGLHWSHEATKFFLSKVSNLMLYGRVSEVDNLNRVFYMILCDTNNNGVVQINKLLMESGFAVYNDNWHERNIKQAGKRVRYEHEEFPSFSMIENGNYPTFNELIELKNNNCDYETIYDIILFHPDKLNKHENAPEAIRTCPYNLFFTNPFIKDIILHSLP